MPERAGIESGSTRARHEARAVALLLYTVTVWDANVVVMKIMTGHFETAYLPEIRMAAAFACIALICRFAGHRVSWPGRKQLGWLAVAAALMIYAHQLLLKQGPTWSTATNGALAPSLSPLLSVLLVHAALTPTVWRAEVWASGWLLWLVVAVSALCSTALGSLAWNYGIARLGLGRTAVFINLLPVSGLAAAVAFLRETLRPAHGIGFALMLAGTWLAVHPQRSEPTRASVHAAAPESP